MGVRLGGTVRTSELGDNLRFLKQYGVEDLRVSSQTLGDFIPQSPEQAGLRLTFLEVVQFRQRCEDAGLRIGAVETGGQGSAFNMEKVWLGLPGRDEQIETIAYNIRVLGAAGIRKLGYHWMVNPPGMVSASWRHSHTTPGRGGAFVTHYDGKVLDASPLFRDREYSEEEMWNYFEYFIKAIIPVCEEADVKLGLHPADPPIPSHGGVRRLVHNVAGFQRAMDTLDSPYNGIDFCLGNWTAMGTDTVASVHRFGTRGKIIYGHAQGVRGAVPDFKETFLDEADCDFLAVIRALNEVGFDGFLSPEHLPHTSGDTDTQQNGTAFGLGYLRALIQAAER